jgi:hypothetical protein
MKTCLITLFSVFLAVKSFAQYKGVVNVYYGVTIGGPLFYNVKWFSVETGVFFTDNKSQFAQLPNGPNVVKPKGDVRMVNIPFYLKFSFLKYLYIYGGFSFDNQTNASSDGIAQSQSGYGGEAGFGVKYKTRHMVFSISPFVFDHAVINLFNKNSNNDLVEKGVKFGIGYAF